MARKKIRQTHLKIQGLNSHGHGTAFLTEEGSDPRDFEVPKTLPGDEVTVSYRKKKRGYWQGEVEELTTPSPLRVPPRCAHFELCGGCRLQHLSYPEQVSWKTQQVQTLFKELFCWEEVAHPTVPCDQPWEYRNKMEFSFSQTREGTLYLGLFMSRGKVLQLTECHLVSSWFAPLLDKVRQWAQKESIPAYHPPSNQGSLRTLIVREGKSSGQRQVMLTISGHPDFALTQEQIQGFKKAVLEECQEEEISPSLFLRIQQLQKGQPTQFFEMHLSGEETIEETLRVTGPSGTSHTLNFSISPSAFFQPNTWQAEKLYSTALQLAEVQPTDLVLDLYCGTGTLGIVLAKEVGEVIGVELSREAALDTRMNAEANGVENYQVIAGDVGHVLEKLREQPNFRPPDVVVVDPPRAGLDQKALEHLTALSPRQILYISCNPATQAENAKELLDKGYFPTHLQAVDQFPHTPHIETILILKKHS